MTRQLLWREYKEEDPDFLGYSQFCELYRRWGKQLHPSMRVPHKAGEKLYVDFAGLSMSYTDPSNGEVKKAYVFVATWGASNYTYAEAFSSQTLTSWISGHIHAFEYFGGVPEVLVPDYVPRNIIGLMCPTLLCGLEEGFQEIRCWLGHIISRVNQAN